MNTDMGFIQSMVVFSVVLVDPLVAGNVGAIARSMANFGLRDLVLVHPCSLGEEAYKRARHGGDILRAARYPQNLEEALLGADLSVGTTGIRSEKEETFHRQTVTPWEVAEKLYHYEGTVALILGRENYGLLNEELNLLDIVVNVPCDPRYPVMNVSHAATILFHELHKVSSPSKAPGRRLATGFEKEKLMEAFHELLRTTRYSRHKRRRSEVMFRRLIGRALPTKWEFHALMGVLRGASKTVRRVSEFPSSGPSS
ncbi:MAG: TrmJ/YjtD family RNA methyltransferase [Thermoplasmata archaeon]